MSLGIPSAKTELRSRGPLGISRSPCHPRGGRVAGVILGEASEGTAQLPPTQPAASKLQMPVFQKTFQAVRTEHAPRLGGPGVRKLRDSAGPVWGLQPPDGGDRSHGCWGTSHVGAGWEYPGGGPGTGRGSACASTLLPSPEPRVAIPARPCRTPGKLAGKESGRLCLSPSSAR